VMKVAQLTVYGVVVCPDFLVVRLRGKTSEWKRV
jgi:hypothetical protein